MNSWNEIEKVKYANGGESVIYENNDTLVILDNKIYFINKNDRTQAINYYDITHLQNYYMKKYKLVYRFSDICKEDIDSNIEKIVNDLEVIDEKKVNHLDFINDTPLEYEFEEDFVRAYGDDSRNFLQKEYPISDNRGKVFYIDYVVMANGDVVGIETNGWSYHHPQVIGKEKYEQQLYKQNVCTKLGIKLYRFSGEDLQFKEQLIDEIKYFLGEKENFKPVGIKTQKSFELYTHQINDLDEISKRRKDGLKSMLIVEPTASGKSKIAEVDIERFSKNKTNFKGLIIVPSKSIKNDWDKRISANKELKYLDIEILTYQYLLRYYNKKDVEEYNYIVVDEAHHFVAPHLRKMIQHFNPEFLLGLTATDERLDGKKLDEVFGSYDTNLSLIDAVKNKIIAEPHVYRIESNIDLSKVRIENKDYSIKDLEVKISVDSRNELIAKLIDEYLSNENMNKKQGLIFCVNIEHTKRMVKVLTDYGINAASYSSSIKSREKIMQDFHNKKIRFLCVCNMLNEGWDYPELEILIMARPTLSKVLYMQQLGRGLRRTKVKKSVLVVDVIDRCGEILKPCSLNVIFNNKYYAPFGSILDNKRNIEGIKEINGLVENIKNIYEVDIETFDEKYKDFLNVENLAREYFVDTATVSNWIKKGKITPTTTFIFGNTKVHLFSPEDVRKYKIKLGIAEHNENTIKKDFFDFLNNKDYTFSYKMVFLLSLLDSIDRSGNAKIMDVLNKYIKFYKNRLSQNLVVDRKKCPYDSERLSDLTYMKKSLLENPFEKFERKRFLYYNPAKDMNIISINPHLFGKLTKEDLDNIRIMMENDLSEYYERIKL